jgi:SAM-dependent methyltransferase
MSLPDASNANATLARLAETAARGDDAEFRTILWERSNDIRHYLLGLRLNGSDEQLTKAYVGDAFVRFLRTLELAPIPPAPRILEIGSNPYFFHALLTHVFPGSTLSGANFFDHDVFSTRVSSTVQRVEETTTGGAFEFSSVLFNVETLTDYPFLPESFDLIFFCETLEHLVVNPLAVFGRLKRILAPGGRLVVTLPNAVRLSNVALMLAGCNFFDVYQEANGIHGRHNREFTLEELCALLGRNGFLVESAETHDRYDYENVPVETVDYTGTRVALPWRKSELISLLRRCGASLDNRGDNLYIRARKPGPGETVLEEACHVAPKVPARSPTWRERLRGVRPPVPVAVRIPDPERSSPKAPIAYFLDRFDASPNSLDVDGWAFLAEDTPHRPAPVTLLFQSEIGVQTWPTETVPRTDVARAKDLPRDDVGFQAHISLPQLPPGRYRLLLRLTPAEGEMQEVATNYSFQVEESRGHNGRR